MGKRRGGRARDENELAHEPPMPHQNQIFFGGTSVHVYVSQSFDPNLQVYIFYRPWYVTQLCDPDLFS